MNSELRELYQQVILDHNKNPKNFGKIDPHNHSAEGFNPLCGDHLFIYLQTEGDVITNISFEGGGCAISKSSASLMTEALKGKSITEAKEFFERFHNMVTGQASEDDDFEDLDKLAIFQGVRDFPVRVKCASLSWHTMIAALDNNNKSISTE
ncbi:MAG: SUF system NifU family Fe-S cluster assembly protein [Ignavibacteria bacterium]|nr:SUF system NifU family Fe-S cluster assembly protein [Ignavibacteria bacterium]